MLLVASVAISSNDIIYKDGQCRRVMSPEVDKASFSCVSGYIV